MSELSDQRVKELELELEGNPFNMRALSEIARWYASRGDYANACQNYEKIVRMDEENGKAWTALGHCYLLKGEYQKCITAYQKALYSMENSRDAQLWYGIGLLYNKFESYDYAEPAYQTVLRIDPEFEHKHEVLYKLGLIYKRTGAYDKAIVYLKKALDCEGLPITRRVDGLCHIGQCYEKLSNYDNAINFYNEALSLDDTNFKTMEYLGWAMAQLGDTDKALSYLLNAKDNVKENCAELGDIHYLMGRIYLQRQNLQDGQACFQRAIYKNPNSFIYWSSIGILYAEAMQAQDAFECFVKASNLSPDQGIIWFNMAVLYERCKQIQEAMLAYQRAISLSNNTLGTQRYEQLQKGEEGPEPSFQHPDIELSESPFSIVKGNLQSKHSKLLPDLSRVANETYEPDESNSDEESHVNNIKTEDLYREASKLSSTYKPVSNTKPTDNSIYLPSNSSFLPNERTPANIRVSNPTNLQVNLQPAFPSQPASQPQPKPQPKLELQNPLPSHSHSQTQFQPLSPPQVPQDSSPSPQPQPTLQPPPLNPTPQSTQQSGFTIPSPTLPQSMPNMHSVQLNPSITQVPLGMQQVPSSISPMPSNIQGMPGAIPGMPCIPNMPNMPNMASMPSMQNMPNIPNMPNMPGMGMPNMGNFGGMPVPNMPGGPGMPPNMSQMMFNQMMMMYQFPYFMNHMQRMMHAMQGPKKEPGNDSSSEGSDTKTKRQGDELKDTRRKKRRK